MKTLFTRPIIIQLHPSSLLLGLLLLVATISNLILFSLPIALKIKLGLLAVIDLSSAYFIARDALLVLPWSWKALEVDTKGSLTLVNKRQQRFKPHLESSSFVHEYCVILNPQNNGFSNALQPVLIFNNVDNLESLRRLRVWLRLYKNNRSKETYPQPIIETTTQIHT
jgi:hypothetical protein